MSGKRVRITKKYASDNLRGPARRLVAEHLMAEYHFSASAATYQNLARDYDELCDWEEHLATGDPHPDYTGDRVHQLAHLKAEWRDFEERCRKVMPYELAAKKGGDSEEEVDTNPDTSGPDVPRRTLDIDEWMARHGRGST